MSLSTRGGRRTVRNSHSRSVFKRSGHPVRVKKNASNQKSRAPFRFHRNGKALARGGPITSDGKGQLLAAGSQSAFCPWLGQRGAPAHNASAIRAVKPAQTRLGLRKICSPDQVKDMSSGGETSSGSGLTWGAGGGRSLRSALPAA